MFASLRVDAAAVPLDGTLGRERTLTASPLSFRTLPLPTVSLTTGGDLEVKETLGQGGMGKVTVGVQRALEREVAVKMLLPEYQDDREARAILLAEALAAGQLEHPNIVPVHLLAQDAAGHPLLVMKRVSGVSWFELLEDDGHVAWGSFQGLSSDHLRSHLEILMQVANAVSFAHSRGVLHRDIKPSNVMVGEFGEVYLVDWGLATRFGAGAPPNAGMLGTPQFVAPEMLDDSLEQGPWTDVYLMAATLHHVLTRTPRHHGADLRETLVNAWRSDPVSYGASVPAELAELANRCTQRDPALRLRSASAFRAALADYLAHRASLALAERAAARLAERPRELRSPEDVALSRRLATEARFGLLSALGDWPENERARAGLREALGVLAEIELAGENLEAARAFAAEIEPPDQQILEAISALDQKLASRAQESSELRAMARDHDPRIDSAGRFWLAIFVTSVAAGTTIFFIARGNTRTDPVGPAGLVLVMVGILLAVGVGILLARKRLFSNALSRRLIGSFLLTLAGIFFHRVLAWVDGRPVELTLRSDMMLSAVALSIVGLFGSRAWLWGALCLFAGSVAATLLPGVEREVFGAAAVLSFLAVAWGEKLRVDSTRAGRQKG